MTANKEEIFYIKQRVVIKALNNKSTIVSIYFSNIRLAIKFKTGKSYSIPLKYLHDIKITDKNFVKILFSITICIPEISPQDISNVTIAQLGKNREGKLIITTSPDWVNNWIVNFTKQNQSSDDLLYCKKFDIFQSGNVPLKDESVKRWHDFQFNNNLSIKEKLLYNINLLKKILFFPLSFKEEFSKLNINKSIPYFCLNTSIIVILLTIISMDWDPISILFNYFKAFLILLFITIGLKIGFSIAKRNIHNKKIFLYSLCGIYPLILFGWIPNFWPLAFIWMLIILFIWIGNGKNSFKTTSIILTPLVGVMLIFLVIGFPYTIMGNISFSLNDKQEYSDLHSSSAEIVIPRQSVEKTQLGPAEKEVIEYLYLGAKELADYEEDFRIFLNNRDMEGLEVISQKMITIAKKYNPEGKNGFFGRKILESKTSSEFMNRANNKGTTECKVSELVQDLGQYIHQMGNAGVSVKQHLTNNYQNDNRYPIYLDQAQSQLSTADQREEINLALREMGFGDIFLEIKDDSSLTNIDREFLQKVINYINEDSRLEEDLKIYTENCDNFNVNQISSNIFDLIKKQRKDLEFYDYKISKKIEDATKENLKHGYIYYFSELSHKADEAVLFAANENTCQQDKIRESFDELKTTREYVLSLYKSFIK